MKRRLLNVLLPLVVSGVFLAGCGVEKTPDPYADARQKTEATLFHEAHTALIRGDYKPAIDALEALDAVYPFGVHAHQAQLDLLYAYFQHGDLPLALAEADRFIRLYPRDRAIDYAYYMKGRAQFDLGANWLQHTIGMDAAKRDLSNKKQAFLSFNEVVRRYPKSTYAYDSMLRMHYIRNLLAEKEVVLAQYYFERKAYVAAVNRAAFVVQHFDGSPQVKPALALLARAYKKLGQTAMARGVRDIQEANGFN